MSLNTIAQNLNLQLITSQKEFDKIEPTACYASDMLSCVMSGAPRQAIWITLQAHMNIVAVAALLELSAIIITENAPLDNHAIERANEKGVTIFTTPLTTFEVAGRLWEMGIRAS